MKKLLITVFIVICILLCAIKCISSDNFHLKRTELFYSSGLSDSCSGSWGLTFGYWTKTTNTYEQATKNLYRAIFDAMDITPSSIVVSVGCGMGNELIYLYENYGPAQIVAVDITMEHVRRARSLIKSKGLRDRIKVIHGSGTQLTKYLPSHFATHVYCIEAINNMPSFSDFIKGAKKVLIPHGGTLAFCDGFKYKVANGLKPYITTQLMSLTWSVHVSNDRTFHDVLADLRKTGFVTKDVLDITKNVWKGYCDFKVKNYEEDIKMRSGYVNAQLFKAINKYLYYYTREYDVRYLIYVGKN